MIGSIPYRESTSRFDNYEAHSATLRLNYNESLDEPNKRLLNL